MITLFVADVQLDARRPKITRAFSRFLQREAVHADALYVLGDLFAAGTGRRGAGPDTTPEMQTAARDIASTLRRVVAHGVTVGLPAGDRDARLIAGAAGQAGLTLLASECVVDCHGAPTLLLSGKTLYRPQPKTGEAVICPRRVRAVLARHGVRHLVHGHADRPGLFEDDGRQRIALAGWREEGSVLAVFPDGLRLDAFPLTA